MIVLMNISKRRCFSILSSLHKMAIFISCFDFDYDFFHYYNIHEFYNIIDPAIIDYFKQEQSIRVHYFRVEKAIMGSL